MDNLWYLVLAYGAVWLAVFAYVISLFQRGKDLRDEVHFLRQMLEHRLAEEEKEGEAR